MGRYIRENLRMEKNKAMEKFNTRKQENGIKVNGILMLDKAKELFSQRIKTPLL